jgi:DNA-directed RNA polymerase specialized sigma24 family protein
LRQESKLVQSLIREVQSGKSSAFEQLYGTHVSRVYTLGLKFFEQNKPAAEEFTKKVFVSAFEQINAYPENVTFILWLRMLAVYEIRENGINKPLEVHDAGNVDEAIFSLPIEEKIIFILHDIEKLENEEITLITKDTVEHINIVLGRARKLMMEKLNVKRLDDLEYKASFLPKKIEPGPGLWKTIFKEISESKKEAPKDQENAGKKFMGLFKKKK